MSAVLQSTAVGCSTLYVNGNRISSPMDPGWAHVPQVRWPFKSYDVTAHATSGSQDAGGEIVVAVLLGKCMWGYRGWDCLEGDDPAACQALLAQLTITCSGGSQQVLATNTEGGTSGWLGTQSPVVFDDLFEGEVWDQQRAEDLEGWMLPGPVPHPPSGPGFQPVKAITPYVSSNLVPQTNPPLAAVANHTVSKGPYRAKDQVVWEFDDNRASICTLQISSSLSGRAGLQGGQWLAVQYGELVNDDGTVHNQFGTGCPVDKVNCASQTDNVTLGSRVQQDGLLWETHFTYHGFKYAALFGWPTGAPLPPADSLQCVALSSSMQPRLDMQFGDGSTIGKETQVGGGSSLPAATVLQTITKAVALTQLNAVHFHPEDCPTREKRGWMGDTQWGAEPLMFAFNAEPIFEVFTQSIRDHQTFGCAQPPSARTLRGHTPGKAVQHATSEAYVYGSSAPLPGPPHELCCGEQKRFGCTPGRTPVNASGSVPDVVPFPWGPIGGFPGDPSWMAAACTIPFGRYTAYGSLSQLGREYVVCSDYLAFMERNLIGGLAMWGFYGDWIAIDKDSNSTLMSTASLIISAQQGASMAKSLGNSEDATRWTALAAKAGLAMRAAFKDPATGRYDSGKGIQASNAMALYTGVETNGTGGAATALIKDVVTTRGMHLSTGSSASRYILQALELCGSPEGAGTVLAPSTRLSGSHVAAQLAVQTTQPSWGFFVVNASLPQTMWERWDVTPPNVGASSLDLPFLGAGVQRWAQTNAAGLNVGYDVSGWGQARNAMVCTIARAEASGIRGGSEIPENFAAECLDSTGTHRGVFSAKLSPSAGAVSQIGQASARLETARG